MKSNELIKTFEQNQIRLQTELEVVKRDLDERNRDFKKERIRIENMIRQEEVNTRLLPKSLFLFFLSKESSITTKNSY